MGEEGKEFNIADWFTYFAFDMTGDLTFAESFGCLEQGVRWYSEIPSRYANL
jgi:hypothetical protein